MVLLVLPFWKEGGWVWEYAWVPARESMAQLAIQGPEKKRTERFIKRRWGNVDKYMGIDTL